MLVLTRKTDEEIIIDGHIRIAVIAIRGNRVQIGVQAPPEVSIRRDDVAHCPKEHEDWRERGMTLSAGRRVPEVVTAEC